MRSRKILQDNTRFYCGCLKSGFPNASFTPAPTVGGLIASFFFEKDASWAFITMSGCWNYYKQNQIECRVLGLKTFIKFTGKIYNRENLHCKASNTKVENIACNRMETWIQTSDNDKITSTTSDNMVRNWVGCPLWNLIRNSQAEAAIAYWSFPIERKLLK